MRYGLDVFILGMVIAIGNAAIKDLQLLPETIGKSIFLMLIMIGMGLLGAGITFPQKRYLKQKDLAARDQEPQPMVLPTANLDRLPSADRSVDDIAMLVNDLEPDSVTEHTTRQLI